MIKIKNGSMAGKILIVVKRVKYMPIPAVKSVKVKCDRCGEECWLAEKNKEILENCEVVCTKCLGLKIEPKWGG